MRGIEVRQSAGFREEVQIISVLLNVCVSQSFWHKQRGVFFGVFLIRGVENEGCIKKIY